MAIPRWQCRSYEALSADQLYAILELRQRVFIVEQNCPYPDLDFRDQHCAHLSAHVDDRLAAYLRCLPPGLKYPESSLGRVVADPDFRGLSLGKELVQRGIDYLWQHWPDSDVYIGAQAYLREFYASFGFVVEGEQYLEDGIAHFDMRLPSNT